MEKPNSITRILFLDSQTANEMASSDLSYSFQDGVFKGILEVIQPCGENERKEYIWEQSFTGRHNIYQ